MHRATAHWAREPISMSLRDPLHDLRHHPLVGGDALRNLRYEHLVALAPARLGVVLLALWHWRRDHQKLLHVEQKRLDEDIHVTLDKSDPLRQKVQPLEHGVAGIRLGRGIEKPSEGFIDDVGFGGPGSLYRS